MVSSTPVASCLAAALLLVPRVPGSCCYAQVAGQSAIWRWSRLLPSVPNLLSAFRIVCAPVLLVLAWNGARGAFLTLFALGLVSDALDGALARRLGQESDFGARLDQWADFALWVSFPLGVWWLWPESVRREAPYAILAIVCLILPTAIAYAKYRAVPCYHTWWAKLDSVLMGIGVPLLLIVDLAWPFRFAALLMLVGMADEIAITYLLPERRDNVPSVFHALRLRQLTASERPDRSLAT